MKQFSENIKQFMGQAVVVCISHKIYGNQELKIRKFQPLCNDDRVGFVVGNQEVFLELDEIENIDVADDTVRLQSDLLSIQIKKI